MESQTRSKESVEEGNNNFMGSVGGNVNWCSHRGEEYRGSLKKLKIELPYDLAIPFLDIYLEKTIIQKYTCTSVFIAALFTIARTWKQPKCPSTDEWIKTMWHINTVEYYSAIENKEIMPFAATWMDLEISYEMKYIRQRERKRHHMTSCIWGISKEMIQINRNRLTDSENLLMVAGKERWGFRIDMCPVLYLNKQGLTL